MTQTFKCKVSGYWMSSLERAYVEITTPKGTTLTIKKWPMYGYTNKWPDEPINSQIYELVWRVVDALGNGKTIDLTKDEVLLWHKYSDLQHVSYENLAKALRRSHGR